MYIGRLNREKGIENLFHAFNGLDGIPATLDVYGAGDEGYATRLADLAHSLGLDGRVRFHGYVEGDAKRNAFFESDVCVEIGRAHV